MAFIVTTKQKMVDMIGYYVDQLRSDAIQMLILPAMACEKPADVEDCLFRNALYSRVPTKSFGAHGGLNTGELKVSTEQTVADAIREMESGAMKSVHLLMKAMEAALPVKTEADISAAYDAITDGTAFIVDTGMGKLPVDKARFAAATGLPAEGKSAQEYSVFLHTVKVEGVKKHVIVAVRKGNEGPAASKDDLLSSHFDSIDARPGFDVPEGFDLPELKTGWDLVAQPKFPDLLAKLRSGYGYIVATSDAGLHIPY